MSHVTKPGNSGGGGIVDSVQGTAPIQVNGVSGVPQTGNVIVSIAGNTVIETIAGDTGTISGSAVTIYAHKSTNNSGASVFFTNSGTVSTLNLTDPNFNTFLGKTAGNATVSADGASNVGVGVEAMISATTASQSVAIGGAALGNVTTGQGNTSVGYASCSVVTGSNNIALGIRAGNNYNSSESNNITIGNTGVASESNVIRIGSSQTKNFQAGITGNTITNTPMMVTIDTSGGATNGQLGAAPIPGGGNIITSGFNVYLSGNVSNVTGDGTRYTLAYNTAQFDIHSDVNLGTGVFTAPFTGYYQFSGTVGADGYNSTHTIQQIFINTTASGDLLTSLVNPFATQAAIISQLGMPFSVFTKMTAGDTASVSFAVFGGTKTVSAVGLQVYSFWSGVLVGT